MAGKVTVSHAFALAEIPEQRLDGLGCDGIRDLWSPWGDVLARAALLAWRAGARREEDPSAALEVATSGGATVFGLPTYGLNPGCPADLALPEPRHSARRSSPTSPFPGPQRGGGSSAHSWGIQP
jgi:cytosine/adenosine deaminase-related metal-dependent hydrolase